MGITHGMSRVGRSLAVLLAGLLVSPASAEAPKPRGLLEVPQNQVKLRGGFWGPRQQTAHETTIPHSLDCLEADGHVTNFDKAAGVAEGTASGHAAFDSDLYKALEGAMYCLQNKPDAKLSKRVDGILDRILAAQQDDGFLIAYFLLREQEYRWERLRTMHQMYNAGHYFEMAIEHHKATGDKKVLDSAMRFADHIDGIFGEGKRYDVDGHQEVELALIKLYRHTGEKRYFDLARFFLDERGHAHGTERKIYDLRTPPRTYSYEKDLPERAKKLRARVRMRNGRAQDHRPIIDEKRAVGHAVRAGYMYAAVTDLVRFSEAPEYEKVLGHLWEDVVGRKMYITGSIGTAQYHDEGFGDAYLLPNRTYCESCANIANVLWQHRMAMLYGDAKYADVMELALYNGAISGIALTGDAFFYQNPLESKGAERRRWIGLSCCPTNLARFIPQVGGFAYGQQDDRVYVNLYATSEATIKLPDDTTVKLRQTTNYPWDGRIKLSVDPQRTTEFTLCLRLPGWALGRPVPSDLYRFTDKTVPSVELKVNGHTVDATPDKDGYIHIRRTWQTSDRPLVQAADVVELELPMPVRRVYAHEKVEANRGRTALMRGPIVYCLEATDHDETDLFKVSLPRDAKLSAEHRPNLLGGVTVLQATGRDDQQHSARLTAVPYYAWCNREKGPMVVWLREP